MLTVFKYKLFALMLFLTSALAGRCQLTWISFTPEVLVRAKEENKMVLLNLEARWCHWCHVMEDSTYADPAVQEYLQDHFILVKEDQDQRADLQIRYKEYGWPATIILNAQGEDVVKRSGFMEPKAFLGLLKAVVRDPSPEQFLPVKVQEVDEVDFLSQGVFQSLDMELGGFDFVQKYVDWPTAEWAFARCSSIPLAGQWLMKSLENSRQLIDQEFGGIYQYSTRGNWNYPHFEKLLAFQARYLELYSRAHAYAMEGNWQHAAASIWRYSENFLIQPNGLWGNSQDADVLPGVHAGDYFKLSADKRLEIGIPRVDVSCFTRENALMVRAGVVYAAATGNTAAFKRCKMVYHHLVERRNKQGFLPHLTDNQRWYSLGDELGFAQASWWLYRYTGEQEYLRELQGSILQIKKFFNGSALVSVVGENGMDPHVSIALNAEAALLLQAYLASFPDNEIEGMLAQTMAYLGSPELVQSTVTEAALLEAMEQIKHAELPRLILVGDPANQKSNDLAAVALASPHARLSMRWIEPHSKEAEEYGDPLEPTVFLCSGTRCSASIQDAQDLKLVLQLLEIN